MKKRIDSLLALRQYSIALFFLIIALDQLSKKGAVFWGVETSCNRALAMGIDLGVLNVVAVSSVLTVVGYYFWFHREDYFSLPLALIFAGGVSNLIDRILLGCVLDFVNFFGFSSFNLADSFVTVGSVGVFYIILTRRKFP